MKKLSESELALLTSVEGHAALSIFLPLLREFALFIAGRTGKPLSLSETDIPELHSKAKLERVNCRGLCD